MKIIRFQIHRIKLPLKNSWKTAYGTEDHIESVLIKAFSRDHQVWVETCPLSTPQYSPETALTVFHMITNFFGPIILGKELENQNSIAKLFSSYRGNNFAKAGIEQCWWSLKSMESGQPLRKLFNGGDQDIPVGGSVGIKDSIDDLLKAVTDLVERGYHRVKLKIKKGWDVEVIRAVREDFPILRLQIDCNGTFSLEDCEIFKRIEPFNLEMIEQPLHYRDLADHAQLQKQIRTPICLDESITCLHDVEQAIRLGSCKIICIKIGRVGGIAEAIRIHDLARENGIGCWIGSMIESCLGASVNLELATLPNCIFPNEITTKGKYHQVDLVEPSLELSDSGHITPSAGPYINRRINEELVHHLTLSKAILG